MLSLGILHGTEEMCKDVDGTLTVDEKMTSRILKKPPNNKNEENIGHKNICGKLKNLRKTTGL